MSTKKHAEWQAAECERLQRALATAEKERDEARVETRDALCGLLEMGEALGAKPGEPVGQAAQRMIAERDAAVADNAAVAVAVRGVDVWLWNSGSFAAYACSGVTKCGTCRGCTTERLHDVASHPHPGAVLLEQHRKELERLSAALADMLRTAENWGHGADCAGDDDEEQLANCECGKAEILAVLNPPDGSLPGAAFLARRDALAKELKEAKRSLVRARNEGLERALDDVRERIFRGTPGSDRVIALECVAEFIEALKEPEE
jgi:hypothetical protein